MKVINPRYKREPNDGFIDIPEYEGIYQMNTAGVVRRLLAHNEARNIEPVVEVSKLRTNSQRSRYFLSKDGKVKRYTIGSLYLHTFNINLPKGQHLFRKNHCISDNEIENFGIATMSYIQKQANSNRKQVLLIKKDNNHIVKSYRSARDAAEKLKVNLKTVHSQCHGKFKNFTKAPDCKLMYARDFYHDVDKRMGD